MKILNKILEENDIEEGLFSKATYNKDYFTDDIKIKNENRKNQLVINGNRAITHKKNYENIISLIRLIVKDDLGLKFPYTFDSGDFNILSVYLKIQSDKAIKDAQKLYKNLKRPFLEFEKAKNKDEAVKILKERILPQITKEIDEFRKYEDKMIKKEEKKQDKQDKMDTINKEQEYEHQVEL